MKTVVELYENRYSQEIEYVYEYIQNHFTNKQFVFVEYPPRQFNQPKIEIGLDINKTKYCDIITYENIHDVLFILTSRGFSVKPIPDYTKAVQATAMNPVDTMSKLIKTEYLVTW
jgi:hypothetical protein